jgi:cell division protein FtsB
LIIKVNNTTRLAITDAGNLSMSGLLPRLGLGAVDLQYSDNLSDDSLVAEGKYSFTVGFKNRAVGNSSLAMGDFNRTYGQSSLAIGVGNTATNDGSIGIGIDNIISSSSSDGILTGTAIGGYNEGVGGSIVIGNYNSSSVDLGLSIGQSNVIRSTSEPSGIAMTIGAYNNVTGDGGIAIGEGLLITGRNSIGIGRDVTNGTFNSSFIIGNRFLNPQAFQPTENDANGQMVMRFEGGYKLYTNDFPNTTQASGVFLAGNGYSWESLSDRNSKENFTSINFQDVLSKLEKLPVTQWNYKTSPSSVIQWGPMAQDFKYYFGLGTHKDSLKISTLEMDGVLMAGVKGLIERSKTSNEKIEELQQTISELQKQLESFKAENVTLKVENKNYEQRLKALESTVQNVLQVLESPKTTVRTVTSKK